MLTDAAGNGVKNTIINDDIACHTARAIQWAQKLDTYAALSEKDLFDVEYWELEQVTKKKLICFTASFTTYAALSEKDFFDVECTGSWSSHAPLNH